MRSAGIIVFFLFFIFLGAYLWSGIFSLFSNSASVCFLDVGQGDSELVRLPKGVNLLIDAGPKGKRCLWQLGEKLPFFEKRIDLVILSHPDADHWGGLENVSSEYRIRAFFWNGDLPENKSLAEKFEKIVSNLKRQDALVKKLSYPDEIAYGGFRIKAIWPRENSFFKKANNNSLVLALKSPGGKRVIFAGDIEKPAEKKIDNIYAGGLRADILKFPHHGSKSSLEENFLEDARPEKIVIEVGRNNPYHHPHKETLDFLNRMKAQIWRTDTSGTVCFNLND